MFVLGELDNEDRVLASEADKHNEADLGEDVVIAAFKPDARDGEEQAHGYDENDGQRQTEALVQRGKHQEDEQYTERINIHRRIAGKNALIR